MTDHEKIIRGGLVAALREFGYPDCTLENCTTDPIYAAFSVAIIQDGLDSIDAPRSAKDAMKTLQRLLAEAKANQFKNGSDD